MTENYCLDASVFINSWIKHYPIDLFPCVWECLDEIMYEDRAIIPQVIYDEVKRGQDKLANWLDWYRRDCVKKADERSVLAVKAIVQKYPRLLQTKRNRSGSGGDPWLIAHAQITGAIVVTEERPTGTLDSPKVPDVCIDLGIDWINTVELLRRRKLTAIRQKVASDGNNTPGYPYHPDD